MRIKYRPEDFRVSELLAEGYLKENGSQRVYRVKKRKRTSLEAAAVLAELVGCPAGDVGMAGLKDRQGVTTQYMSVPVRKPVHLVERDIVIEPEGFADEPLESRHSDGNAFEVRLRGLTQKEFTELGPELEAVRSHGVINYFGEQRFGNLRFGQGWIARELALGRHEKALEQLLCSPSDQDDEHHARFKQAWRKRWGDWRECRDIAGRFGAHHSVFEHLAKNPTDFAGAFRYVSSRLRLIHLYAWQSHLWNRTVASWVRETHPRKDIFWVETLEGRLVFPRGALAEDPNFRNRWRLPGPRLEDVENPVQLEAFTKALALEDLKPEQFTIEGISGFQLKGEERELVILPRRLRSEEIGRDNEEGFIDVKLSFELPRGAYATMLLARLFPTAEAPGPEDPRHADRITLRRRQREEPRRGGPRPPRGPRRDTRNPG
ncbi:MAG: tRNA pseudouridine(13) synthase TruD [Planctomycetes bacterium]|nr:tRNA pseudouridine(13) synthase TruD [Planctomycetota bacterium]